MILFSPAWTNVGLWRVSAGGGPPEELTKPDRAKGESGHFWPDFLPDGRAALFTIFGGKGLVDSKVGLARSRDAALRGCSSRAPPPATWHSGHILYYKGGVYRTVPFDSARRRVSGPETTVLPTVRRLHSAGRQGELRRARAAEGALAFVEGDSSLGAPLSRLTWVARDGRREDLPFEAYHDLRALSLSPDGTRAAVGRVEQGQLQVHVYDLARGTGEAVTRDGQNWSPRGIRTAGSLAVTSQLHGNFDVRRVVGRRSLGARERAWRRTRTRATGAGRPTARRASSGSGRPSRGQDLWRARGDGSEPAPLVASALEEDDPAFSPDGPLAGLHCRSASLYVGPLPGSLTPRVLDRSGRGKPALEPRGEPSSSTSRRIA